MLTLVLFVSSLGMVPGQPPTLLGVELLVLGLITLTWVVVRDIGTVRMTEANFRTSMLRLLPVGWLATACTAVAGASLLAGTGGGLYWLAPAVLLAFAAALVDAWVLLIEIVR